MNNNLIKINLKYKQKTYLNLLNISFEYINLFKPFNVNVDFDNQTLSVSGLQKDWVHLLNRLQKDFDFQNVLLNVIVYLYIQNTNDKTLPFITSDLLSRLYKDWLSYSSKYLNI